MELYIIALIVSVIELAIVSLIPSNTVKLKGSNYSAPLNLFCGRAILLINCIILAYFMIMRAPSVGSDLAAYIRIFNSTGKANLSEIFSMTVNNSVELGYLLVNKFFYFLSPTTDFFMFSNSIIIMVLIYLFIRKQSILPVFSIFLFLSFGFYNFSFNTIRQFIALGILMLSLSALQKRKLRLFVIETICAALFHFTAIIFLLLYFLDRMWKTRKNIIIVAIISIGGTLLFGGLISAIFASIGRYSIYQNRGGAGAGFFIIELFITIIYIVFFDQFKKKNKNASLWIYMSILATAFSILGNQMDLFLRISEYFAVGYVISIPYFVMSFSEKKNKIIAAILTVLLFSSYYIYLLNNSTVSGTVPYLMR